MFHWSKSTINILMKTYSGGPFECSDIEDNTDGIYSIYPGGRRRQMSVYCIMRGEKKWTVSCFMYKCM